METKKKPRAAEPAAPAPTHRPVKMFRQDDVSASIFARPRSFQGAERTFYSVSFTRSYKGNDGVWKYTRNFDAEDLGKVVTVAKCAAEFIHEQQQQQDA